MPRTTEHAGGASPGSGAAASGHVDGAVQEYIDSIAAEHRPLFDRLHRLILAEYPEASVALSYKMPTYRVGGHRFYVAVWRHGVSIYGLKQGRDAGFMARHPELKSSKGTYRLRQQDADAISDTELRDLVRAALAG
jgi:uncharacterized protein YdhG (YjbR/CyaY superfamily)